MNKIENYKPFPRFQRALLKEFHIKRMEQIINFQSQVPDSHVAEVPLTTSHKYLAAYTKLVSACFQSQRRQNAPSLIGLNMSTGGDSKGARNRIFSMPGPLVAYQPHSI